MGCTFTYWDICMKGLLNRLTDSLNWGRLKLVHLLFKGKVAPRLCIADDVPTNSSREMPVIDLLRWCDINLHGKEQVCEKQDRIVQDSQAS